MPCEKEWEALLKKEQRLLEKRKEKKETALNRLLAEKVPEKLQHTLDIAFEKAFHLIFEKGTGIIEKTYQKDKLKKSLKSICMRTRFTVPGKPFENFPKKQDRQAPEPGGFRCFRCGNGAFGYWASGYSHIYRDDFKVYL